MQAAPSSWGGRPRLPPAACRRPAWRLQSAPVPGLGAGCGCIIMGHANWAAGPCSSAPRMRRRSPPCTAVEHCTPAHGAPSAAGTQQMQRSGLNWALNHRMQLLAGAQPGWGRPVRHLLVASCTVSHCRWWEPWHTQQASSASLVPSIHCLACTERPPDGPAAAVDQRTTRAACQAPNCVAATCNQQAR